ncbi:MAG: flagellar motor switch phosphatase FliY [Thermotogota bacterium]|nr:flagellar motor switch phosphatase FliY [Thermotogota bacterium]
MTDNNDFLSQDELDALLGAINSGNEGEEEEEEAKSPSVEVEGSQGSLTSAEIDMIGEVGNMIMGSASTALFTIIGQNVDITTPKVSVIKLDSLKDQFDGERLVTTLNFEDAIEGINFFLVDAKTASIIADLMMGGTAENVDAQMDEMKMSAVGEAMNQMMGAASTSMSEFLDGSVNITPPQVSMVDFNDENVEFPPAEAKAENEIVLVSFDMSIGSFANTNIFQILPIKFVKDLYAKVTQSGGEETQKLDLEEKPQPAQQEPQQPTRAATKQTQPQQPQREGAYMPPKPKKQEAVNAQPVEFEDFDEPVYTQLPKQLELLYDVPLEITVELGRSKLKLKEIMDLNIGSIIELDKLTGEHIDVLVNGKVIAKGEVVVVSESFGVRITEIINPRERIGSLR